MYESLVIGRSSMMNRVMLFLVEHIFANLAYNQGEHGQHSRVEISACTQGEHNPFPFMTKCKSDLGLPSSPKGGDCWNYDIGLALWHMYCP